ncbi:hypothetical protein Tco_1165301 [Tanacetum coccineum]
MGSSSQYRVDSGLVMELELAMQRGRKSLVVVDWRDLKSTLIAVLVEDGGNSPEEVGMFSECPPTRKLEDWGVVHRTLQHPIAIAFPIGTNNADAKICSSVRG